jgi:hypothetical protein
MANQTVCRWTLGERCGDLQGTRLGVPQESIDSLSWEFARGWSRAQDLGDFGSAPEGNNRWVVQTFMSLVVVAPDERLEATLDRARETYRNMPDIKAIWRQNCHALETEKEPFDFETGQSSGD